jgi:hypothetical protein
LPHGFAFVTHTQFALTSVKYLVCFVIIHSTRALFAGFAQRSHIVFSCPF